LEIPKRPYIDFVLRKIRFLGFPSTRNYEKQKKAENIFIDLILLLHNNILTAAVIRNSVEQKRSFGTA
jgi:hypothetical protein